MENPWRWRSLDYIFLGKEVVNGPGEGPGSLRNTEPHMLCRSCREHENRVVYKVKPEGPPRLGLLGVVLS
jgi:hypothetical protein